MVRHASSSGSAPQVARLRPTHIEAACKSNASLNLPCGDCVQYWVTDTVQVSSSRRDTKSHLVVP
ncbi:hypothetical protein PanWU01x14_227260 [Parasponia andersonii]|uniref:Uncharacterized protein n=1 Tax=Parasponia andersonii TaxID=3476 RepID=A0A2P5BMA3_PARAD|nr:hypothetical protein PanWU01x14_227260 [Parasponia andersonii]